MRQRAIPEHTRRVIKKYLLTPETKPIGDWLGPQQWRWLEIAYIQQTRLYTSRFGFWSDDCWVTKAEYDRPD